MNWPIVTAGDDGIRPAGRSDECFYCHQKVGSPHTKRCVTVLKEVKYNVRMNGEIVGTFTRNDPYHWTEHDCNFHKNESSWCANNAINSTQWTDKDAEEKIKRIEDCACGVLSFEFVEVTKPGPFQNPKE